VRVPDTVKAKGLFMLLRTLICLSLLSVVLLLPPAAVQAVEGPAATEGSVTGLPLPRFVSIKAGKANLRAGPGQKYPVRWIYLRRNLPVQIVGEHENWREIRDPWGEEGWLHSSLLSGRRTAVVRGDLVALRDGSDEAAPVLMYLERRVIVTVEACRAFWCRISVDGRAGWLPADAVYGAD